MWGWEKWPNGLSQNEHLYTAVITLKTGPSKASSLPESPIRPYEVFNIREKLFRAIDELNKQKDDEFMETLEPKIGKQANNDRRSRITKSKLNQVNFKRFNIKRYS